MNKRALMLLMPALILSGIVFLLPYIYTTLSGFTLTLFDRMQGLG